MTAVRKFPRMRLHPCHKLISNKELQKCIFKQLTAKIQSQRAQNSRARLDSGILKAAGWLKPMEVG